MRHFLVVFVLMLLWSLPFANALPAGYGEWWLGFYLGDPSLANFSPLIQRSGINKGGVSIGRTCLVDNVVQSCGSVSATASALRVWVSISTPSIWNLDHFPKSQWSMANARFAERLLINTNSPLAMSSCANSKCLFRATLAVSGNYDWNSSVLSAPIANGPVSIAFGLLDPNNEAFYDARFFVPTKFGIGSFSTTQKMKGVKFDLDKPFTIETYLAVAAQIEKCPGDPLVYSCNSNATAAFNKSLRISEISIEDSLGNSIPLSDFVITSESGAEYGPNGVSGPPVVSCTATPSSLWPPNKNPVLVTVSGTVIPGTQPIPLGDTRYAVTDDYGQVEPSGSIAIDEYGNYSFEVPLIADRDGEDQDGRPYTIVVSARDDAGKIGSCSTVVTVPHDQGK